MKIVVLNNIEQSAPYITLRPDNAVLRNNDDFYIPHFSNDIVCNCGLIVRITRLAKSIAPKFASRCYDSVTAGVTFVARDAMQSAIAAGLPCDEAYSFDRSTAVGTDWLEPTGLSQCSIRMNIGDNCTEFNIANASELIDNCIARATERLTLKMGDLLFIAASEALPATQAQNITVTLNDITPLNFQIK